MNRLRIFDPNWLKTGEPSREFAAMRRDMERALEDMMRGFDVPAATGQAGAEGQILAPRLDVAESEHGLDVTVELPGVPEDSIDVTIHGDVLRIRAEKKSEREDKTKEYHVVERAYGRYERAIPLGFEPKDDPTASYDHGVLKIAIKKPTDAVERVRKVTISKS